MSEINEATNLTHETLIAITAIPGTCFWRQNVGAAFTQRGQFLRFGVAGQSDILGIKKTLITPEMVGQYIGAGIAIENKYGTGRAAKNQKDFRTAWEKAAGIYVIGRSVEDALKVVMP
jgi:hypothetical protein